MLDPVSGCGPNCMSRTGHCTTRKPATLSLVKYCALARRLGLAWDAWDHAAPRDSSGDQAPILDLLVVAQALVVDLEPIDKATIAYTGIHSGEIDASRQCRELLFRARDILISRRPWLVKRWRLILLCALAFGGLLAMVAHVWAVFSTEFGADVSYYNRQNFTLYGGRWVEQRISKDYGSPRLYPLIFSKEFSARWEGYLIAPKDADYSFYLQSIGGARLFIDGVLVSDHWNSRQWNPGRHAETFLASGAHRLVVEHQNNGDGAAIRLRWTGGGIPENTVVGSPFLQRNRVKIWDKTCDCKISGHLLVEGGGFP